MAETQTVDPEKARDDLLDLFEQEQDKLKEDTDYYEAEERANAASPAVPPTMRDYTAAVGYPRLYVDSIAERQELTGFQLGDKEEADKDLWSWWQANNLDVEATLGHTDALIYGRAYITVAAPDPELYPDADPEVPIIRVEPPTAMYAQIDPRTRQVTQAIRAVKDDDGEVIAATLYLPDRTMLWVKEEGEWAAPTTVAHGLEMVPVIPISNRTRLSDMNGSSQITKELRSITDTAAQILMNLRNTANIMAVPQRLLFGVKPEELGIDPETGQRLFDAYLANIIAFEDHEAKAQQFQAAELRNFVDALDAIDKKGAAYTGLPPQYLSTTTDNPASAEAMRASESRLVLTTERKNKIFGGAWEQAMRVAYKVIKGGDIPPEYYRMEAIWADPATPTYAAKADAATKLYGNGQGVIPKEQARIDMGYSSTDRENMRGWDEEEASLGLGLVGTMLDGPTPAQTKPAAAQPKPDTGGADAA
ncbi:portal protein [Mycobacterium phage Stephig9]|uniref:Portal protein n=1 Tax=Mycobacterium phage Stephig9 TaxID=2591224 RepID=A0A514DH95_9CAUD|nr:portal protein [Mycobacterium phage Stephig9]